MTLLQEIETDRRNTREELRRQTLHQLREVLSELAPASSVVIFGSLLKPGRFKETSDIDLALADQPRDMSLYRLTGLLAERLGRPVDVVLLSECRFREKVLREGERW